MDLARPLIVPRRLTDLPEGATVLDLGGFDRAHLRDFAGKPGLILRARDPLDAAAAAERLAALGCEGVAWLDA